MIITTKSNKEDWYWLRNAFDCFKSEYFGKELYKWWNVSKGMNDDRGNEASKYAAERMLTVYGVETKPYVIVSDNSYHGRKFEIVDVDKFVFNKLARSNVPSEPGGDLNCS